MNRIGVLRDTDGEYPSSQGADSKVIALRSKLLALGQHHLLKFWGELSSDQKSELIGQIQQIDFEKLQALVGSNSSATAHDDVELEAEQHPVTVVEHEDVCGTAAACEAGQAALAKGEVGALIVAGGEGSRLSFDGPKGCFPLGPISGASLYQLLLEKVVASSRRYGVDVPVYVMTSPATHAATVSYLDAADWFGVSADCRHVFCQGTMPAVDPDGRILLESKSRLCLSPDGHGGVVSALSQDRLLDSMHSEGVEHLFYCQIDNPAVPLLDLKLIGQHVLSGADVTVLTVEKTDAAERAGTVVSINDRLHVLEYSLISESIANACDADGELKFRAANTGIHLFRTDFLMRESRDARALPFHPAYKEVAHIDERGEMVEPESPNAIKFERFVFDMFPRAEKTMLIPVDREQCFLPLKDASSSETSPQAVQKKLCELHRNWLVQAGIDVSPDANVEIGPLVACNADELTERVAATGWRPEENGPEVYVDRAA